MLLTTLEQVHGQPMYRRECREHNLVWYSCSRDRLPESCPLDVTRKKGVQSLGWREYQRWMSAAGVRRV